MDAPAIGTRIRQRRRQLGLTLDDVASSSGVSATMLSEVERSVKNPTVKLAYQIARALRCSLTELLEEASPTRAQLVRAKDRRTLVDPDSRVQRHGLSTELLRRGLEVAWYVLPEGQSTGTMSPNRAGILEQIIVLTGELSFRLGDEHFELRHGDSISYGPQQATEYRNQGYGPCEFLMLADSSGATP